MTEKLLETDWEGKEICPTENADTMISVWEVSPHPCDNDSILLERSWQSMLQYMRDQLEGFLEAANEDQLREGVTLTFRLVRIPKHEYEEIASVEH